MRIIVMHPEKKWRGLFFFQPGLHFRFCRFRPPGDISVVYLRSCPGQGETIRVVIEALGKSELRVENKRRYKRGRFVTIAFQYLRECVDFRI